MTNKFVRNNGNNHLTCIFVSDLPTVITVFAILQNEIFSDLPTVIIMYDFVERFPQICKQLFIMYDFMSLLKENFLRFANSYYNMYNILRFCRKKFSQICQQLLLLCTILRFYGKKFSQICQQVSYYYNFAILQKEIFSDLLTVIIICTILP